LLLRSHDRTAACCAELNETTSSTDTGRPIAAKYTPAAAEYSSPSQPASIAAENFVPSGPDNLEEPSLVIVETIRGRRFAEETSRRFGGPGLPIKGRDPFGEVVEEQSRLPAFGDPMVEPDVDRKLLAGIARHADDAG
jgi:hypothetical protein